MYFNDEATIKYVARTIKGVVHVFSDYIKHKFINGRRLAPFHK
jgi:hypothetical protein